MSNWIQGDVGYSWKVNIFTLHVWPIEQSVTYPYQAWIIIDEDGDSNILPCSYEKIAGAKYGEKPKYKITKFETLDGAKNWVENELRKLCEETLKKLI